MHFFEYQQKSLSFCPAPGALCASRVSQGCGSVGVQREGALGWMWRQEGASQPEGAHNRLEGASLLSVGSSPDCRTGQGIRRQPTSCVYTQYTYLA